MAILKSNTITFIDNTGSEKYLYIRYSNDGQTFTENEGLTPGEWLGTCTTNSSTAPTNFNAYKWSKIKGEAGKDGQDGIPGTNGENGKTTYFHVKYSDVVNPTYEQMTEIPSKYIGTYVDYTEDDSTNPDDYKWIQFIGDNGIPGENGIDGKTYYLHIKYSNDGGQTFTDNNGEDPGEYLGVYTDTTEEDSLDATKYTWSLIKGQDAITYYTWIKYADDANGTNMSDSPDGKTYMGIAYNKESSQESNIPTDYIWSLIKGANGIDGDNGITYYTWVKYADDNVGNGISDDPTGKEYIGIAYNKLESIESSDPNEYTWSLFKGADGIDGQNGAAGKGIKSISEYYLLSISNSGVTTNTSGWSTEIPTLDRINKYLWNYEVTEFTTGEIDATEPIIIGVYGETGSSLQVKYISSVDVPVINNNDVSGWLDYIPVFESGKKIFMTQKLSDEINWSLPIQISAVDGEANVEIVDGYWYINGELTNVKAEGEDGIAPEITIGENGNWFIDGVDSGTQAQGEAGKDGSNIEFVYYVSKTAVNLPSPSYTDGILTDGWTVSPQGITDVYKYEYISTRTLPPGGEWSEFSTPVVWSKWGEKGQDGDGVEYKYYLSNSSDIPTYSVDNTAWTDDPQGVSVDNQYEYVVQIKIINGNPVVSQPSLWAKFGEDGNGIKDIVNYYAVTTEPLVPSQWIPKMPPAISNTNKYLWNYEEIIYTNGDIKTTDPAIIGVYGDNGTNGTDAVDFQIYSVNGFEFQEGLDKIELKTIAFQNGAKLPESEVTYQWKWWNTESGLDDKYESIPDATLSTLTVNINDSYAFSSLKCEMTYDGIVYVDYVSLTQSVSIYTATAKFFNGNNIITSNDNYLVAYIELYKDNDPEELLSGDKIYVSDTNIIQDGMISTDINGEYEDGDNMYFVCKNTYDDIVEYDVVLGEYTDSKWQVVSNNYIYKNDLFVHATSPVVFIPKEKISRSLTINFEIYTNNAVVARTSAMVLDFNDPTISSDAPTDPQNGQLWLDTSVSPSVLKMWDGFEWINSGYQNGNVVYTSRPIDGYSKGDLWILSEDDVEYSNNNVKYFEEFGVGAMLKAIVTSSTFDPTHWVDVDKEATEQKKNIKQYFLFNAETGLRIGQSNNKFYVNISSTRMSFCENPLVQSSENEDYIDPNEVVSISNKSATIKNLTVEDGAIFNCEVQFGKFILKTEANGSLSLALAN